MNIEKSHLRASELHTENVLEAVEKPRQSDKDRRRLEKRPSRTQLGDETANFIRQESDKLIKDIRDQSQAELKKVTEQLAKDISDSTLTATERTSLQTQANKDRQKIKEQYEEAIYEAKIQLKYQSHEALGYLHTTMGKANMKRQNQEYLDEAKKTVKETANKLYEKNAELDKIEDKTKKAAEKLQNSLKDLEDARGSKEVSHASASDSQTTIVLNQYYKALTQAHDMMSEKKDKEITPKALKHKTAEKILETALATRTGPLWEEFSTAQKTINDKHAAEDQCAAAVKTLLQQALKQHTTFRLDPADNTQDLSPEAHIEKRLKKVLTQEDVHRTMQQARRVLEATPQEFQKSLKKAVIETINHALQSDAQEKVIHQEAAKQFMRQVRASSEIRRDIRQDAATSFKLGREEKIANIENADAEMQHALDLVKLFSPEALKKVQTFRQDLDFQDRRSNPQQFDLASALDELQQNLKKSSASLPKLHEDIQRYLNIDPGSDPKEIPSIAKSAINELMQLGKKQISDTKDLDRNEYEYLNKQINERYAKAIKKAQASDSNVKEKKEKAEAQRNVSLAALARLYPKATIEKKIEKVQEDTLKLQEVLAKKVQKIISVKEILDKGERAFASQRRYEINNQGEYLVMQDQMVEQEKKITAAQSNITAAQENEKYYLDELHKAENKRDEAKDKFEMAHSNSKKMNNGSLQEINESNPLVEEAKKIYDDACEAVRLARLKRGEATVEKFMAISVKEQEQHTYTILEVQKDRAKKHYDNDEDKVKRYIEGSREIMKQSIAFARQQRQMKEHYHFQLRAALISGLNPSPTDSFNRLGTSQFTGINNWLIKS